MKLSLALMPFLILITACSASDDVSSFQNIDPVTFNDQIQEARKQNESWADNPTDITRRLFEVQLEGSRKSSISHKTVNKESVVTFTQEGFSDDSVKGEKLIVTFSSAGGAWMISNIKKGFTCWDGRGHAHYSGEPCN